MVLIFFLSNIHHLNLLPTLILILKLCSTADLIIFQSRLQQLIIKSQLIHYSPEHISDFIIIFFLILSNRTVLLKQNYFIHKVIKATCYPVSLLLKEKDTTFLFQVHYSYENVFQSFIQTSWSLAFLFLQ